MVPLPLQSRVSKDIATGVMATLAIYSMSIFMPVVGFFFAIFTPLPVLFYRTKLGRRHGMIVPILAIAAMGLLLGGVTVDMLFFSGLMFLGFAMSEMFEKELSIEFTIAGACAIVIGVGLLGIVLYSMINQKGLFSLVSTYVANNLALSLELYKEIGMPRETIDAISNSLDRIQYVLVRIMPSMVVASLLFVAWTNLIAAKPIMRRRGLSYPSFGRLNHWRAPESLVWGVIGCGVILLLPVTGIRLLGVNGLLVLLTVYFIQGITIVSFFFEKKKVPTVVRVILYMIIAFQQLILLAIICMGLFDMWINFRKINVDKKKPDLPS